MKPKLKWNIKLILLIVIFVWDHIQKFSIFFRWNMWFFYYTSATKEYTKQIINYIDNINCYFKKSYIDKIVFIFLRSFKNFPLELIIDDNLNCYLNYKDHIIQISYWEGDSSDDSLYKIQNILFSFIEKYSSLSSDNLSEKKKI